MLTLPGHRLRAAMLRGFLRAIDALAHTVLASPHILTIKRLADDSDDDILHYDAAAIITFTHMFELPHASFPTASTFFFAFGDSRLVYYMAF